MIIKILEILISSKNYSVFNYKKGSNFLKLFLNSTDISFSSSCVLTHSLQSILSGTFNKSSLATTSLCELKFGK